MLYTRALAAVLKDGLNDRVFLEPFYYYTKQSQYRHKPTKMTVLTYSTLFMSLGKQ